MNDWIIWPVGIALWLGVGLALFFVFEVPALRKGDVGDVTTLSNFVWTLFRYFPVSIVYLTFNFGMIIGGLMVHFFWHWCPAGSLVGG